jgi:hypothetical protein
MPDFPANEQKTPGNHIEKRLLTSVAVLAVATLLVVWGAMRFAAVEILEHEATSQARNWAHFISNDVDDLERFVRGDSATPNDYRVLNMAQNVGDVFSYRILDQDGTVTQASNSGSVGTIVNTAFFRDIVS